MTAGFGLEKLGLLTLRFPRATLVCVLLLVVVSIVGSQRVGFSSDIREIFRSGSQDFETLSEANRQYQTVSREILILVEGKDLFKPSNLQALSNLDIELPLIDGVGDTVSMFTAHRPPASDDALPVPVCPVDLEGLDDTTELKAEVLAHPLVKDKLLSADGSFMLYALSLKEPVEDIDKLRDLVGEVRKLATEFLEPTGLSFRLSGTSAVRLDIIGALIRDQKLFRIVGLSVSVILCFFFFRSWRYVIIALAPAALSQIGLGGGMGWAGQSINVLTNIIPALVMVIAFSSALHLMFTMRRNIRKGQDKRTAIANAVNDVGPACVLASGTTALALMSLTIVPHPFIVSFGLTAALGVAFAFICIMATVPPLGLLLLREPTPEMSAREEADPVRRAVAAVSSYCADLVREHARILAIVGIGITVCAGVLAVLNAPRYQYTDNLPSDNVAVLASETVNEKLSGANVLIVLLQWPQDAPPGSDELMEVVSEVHKVVDADARVKAPTSLRGVEDWYLSGGRDREAFVKFMESGQSPVLKSLYSPDGRSALVTGQFANLDAADAIALMDEISADLEPLRARYPMVKMEPTSLLSVSARASTEMIGELNHSLFVAIAVIIVLIALAFRSVFAGLVSIVPNLFPITIIGAWLYLTDRGLQFTSVVAFTIGFGMAVDSTIHVLNRFRVERERGGNVEDSIYQTIVAIGPVLIVGTLVLISGVVGTLMSEMPMVQLYGEMITSLLFVALLGDLIFLPAIMRYVYGQLAIRRRMLTDKPAEN